MSRHLYHAVDTNQKGIVEFLRACGCSVLSLSRMGEGCPDLLISYRGKLALVEIKSGRNDLTEKQQKFIAAWGSPVHIVRDLADCTDLLESLAMPENTVFA